MPNKIIEKEKSVSVRLDGAYTNFAKHFFTPKIKEDNGETKENYFGSFSFLEPKEAKKTLFDAVKILRKKIPNINDSVFYGQYPKWKEDAQYGEQLSANGKVKFYIGVTNKIEIPENEAENYTYALEVHLTATKSNDIFLRVARAIKTGEREGKYEDDLFDDVDDISEEDMPF